MKQIFISIAICLNVVGAFAQSLQLTAIKNSAQQNSPELSTKFERYSLFSLNLEKVLQELSSKKEAVQIKFDFPGMPSIETKLNTVEVLGEDCRIIIQTETGVNIQRDRPEVYSYQGTILGHPNGIAAITISEGFMSGFFDFGDGNRYYIEPASPFGHKENKNQFVFYNNSDVLESDTERKSLAEVVQDYAANKNLQEPQDVDRVRCSPKKLEIGIANDYQMVQLFGSSAAVINHDIAVMNLVQTNFDNEFIQPLRFKIQSIFVSQCATCDPWSLTPSYVQLYGEFVDWLNAGGFGPMAIDWGLLLTPREIDGNISGYTLWNQMCEYSRASLIINYTDIMCKLQKHVAFGIGMSFGAFPTATGIMRSGGICSNDWEPVSVAEINQGILTKTCLSTCVAQPPAIPLDFTCHWTVQGQECVTFNNPCVASYSVGTDDPTLVVTTSGTTICIQSLVEGQRTAHVYVFANDFCGNASSIGVSWTVEIDCHSPERNSEDDTVDFDNSLTVTQDNGFMIVNDQSLAPELKTIRLFDLSGKLILKQTESSSLIRIPIQSLPTGLYVAHVLTGTKKVVKKVYHF